MKINLEELSKLERRLNIEVPIERVSKAFEKIYQRIQNNVTLKGFRKGKAPLQMIKEMYRDQARTDVLQDLVEEHFFDAIEQHKLRPIHQPKIQIHDFEESKPFSFSADFEIHPEIQLINYHNLSVIKQKAETGEKEINESLEKIKAQHFELVPVFEDRAANNGDIVVIDFKGFVDGQPLENGSGSSHNLELGSNQFIPGFEEGLVGSKPSQTRTLDLSFPQDYHVAALAGKPVKFEVTVKELKTKKLPESDDALAVKVGFKDLAELRNAISQEQIATEKNKIQEDLRNRLLKELAKQNPIDVPKSMVEHQKQVLIEDMKERMRGMGMGEDNFKEYAEKWDSDFLSSASFMVQSSYLITAIANKENLSATSEDIENKIEDYIAQTGMEPTRVRAIYQKDTARARLKNMITEEKVVNFLESKATITEVSKSEMKD